MTDRLKELTKNNLFLDQIEIEMDTIEEINPSEGSMSNFFKDVSEIKDRIKKISKDSSLLERKYATILSDIKASNSAEEDKEEIESLRKGISKEIDSVKEKLKNFENNNKKIMEEDGEGSAEYRMRVSQFRMLQKSFQESCQEYAKVQSEYKSKQEETLKRHIRIVNSNATDEEVEKMLSDPNVELSQLFSQAIIGSSALHTRDAIYNRVKETRDDLLRLEDGMNELVELFRDLNTLVHSQQALFDSIEINVMKASDYVEKGIANTKAAKKHQKKSRIMLILVICAVLALIGVIVGIMILVIAIVLPVVLVKRK